MRVTGRRGFSPLRSHDFSAGNCALQNDLPPPQNRVNLWLNTEQNRRGRGISLSILGPLPSPARGSPKLGKRGATG